MRDLLQSINTNPNKKLYLYIINSAIRDLSSSNKKYRQHAKDWIAMPEETEMSFAWMIQAVFGDSLSSVRLNKIKSQISSSGFLKNKKLFYMFEEGTCRKGIGNKKAFLNRRKTDVG